MGMVIWKYQETQQTILLETDKAFWTIYRVSRSNWSR